MPATIHKFPCGSQMPEPTRADDERDLILIAEAEAAGLTVLFDGDPVPYVSPYLERPLRTEAEVRAKLGRPRPSKASGLFLSLRKLIGGGQ